MGYTTGTFSSWLHEFTNLVHQNKGYLTELDAAIGDADHGSNMDRGTTVMADQLGDEAPGALLKKAGMSLVSSVGGASGPLYGTLLMRMGASLGDADSVDLQQLTTGLRAGVDGLAARGKSTTGEKTMLDALVPACDALEAAVAEGASAPEALTRAAQAAREGRESTVDMVATKGRASYLGERARGHQDPGATSATYLVEALAGVVASA